MSSTETSRLGAVHRTFDEVSLGIGFIEMEAPGQEGMGYGGRNKSQFRGKQI